jgi:hypothetical protein
MSAERWLYEVERLLPRYKRLFLSQSQDEFHDACEALIQDVVRRMEGRRSTYRKLDERDLSKLLAELLGEPVAAAERDQNGHVDVLIQHPAGLGFNHITECKIWDGEKTHRGGMAQLLRYTTGREGRALMLSFFMKEKRMVFLLERLSRDLDAPGGVPPVTQPCAPHPTLQNGAFVSYHEHPSGAALLITHMGCYLFDETP